MDIPLMEHFRDRPYNLQGGGGYGDFLRSEFFFSDAKRDFFPRI